MTAHVPEGASHHGIRMRLLLTHLVVVVTGIATSMAVAMIIGPPMIRALMDRAVVPGHGGDHPYERAFRHATAVSVGIALAVSALATLALSWYLSRRVHRSATALSSAASAIADGQYGIRVPAPRLGREFDAVAAAFNTMAERLGVVDEARRRMVADLAHEIRTPVAVLEAYMEALEDGVARLDADTAATLREQTRRLTRLGADVTALADAESRATSIDVRRVAPAELIDATIAAFAPSYQAAGVSLRADRGSELPALHVDPERLGQVMANLLTNALRHTHRGGTVRIAARRDGAAVALTVTDDGDGVAAEHLDRLFDRFFRVDGARNRRHGGAGIGLSIARALVEAHGGRLDAHSDGPGTGCTFTVTLPVVDDAVRAEPDPVMITAKG